MHKIEIPCCRAHIRCKTNSHCPLFYPFFQDANDFFVHRFAFVQCIMTSEVLFYMDHKPVAVLTVSDPETGGYCRSSQCEQNFFHRKYDGFRLN